MLLTYRYRIKDANTAKHLNRMAIEVNQVWNYCGGIMNDSKRLNRKWPSAFDLIGLTSGSSKELGLHSDTVQAVCKQFAQSRDKAGKRPKWRISFGSKRSLGWIPFQSSRAIGITNDEITYLKRKYRIWLSRPIPSSYDYKDYKDSSRIRSGSFSQDSLGRWYINLVYTVEDNLTTGQGEVGIDPGLKDVITLSTGKSIPNPRYLSKSARKLARAQRAGRRALARKIYRKVAAQRRHFLHVLSKQLARENKLIVMGNVNSSALARTNMAKSVLDAGWSMLRSMLRYKAIRHGASYFEVDERYTTQTCHSCGTRSGPKGLEGLGVRQWICDSCNQHHERDVNAAKNILLLGQSIALPAESLVQLRAEIPALTEAL